MRNFAPQKTKSLPQRVAEFINRVLGKPLKKQDYAEK